LKDVAAQAETLQRMLFEAGITFDQLELLTQGADSDAGLRDELWVLAQEIQWHLSSSANQLRRRWRGSADGQPFPPAVAAWLDDVESLDEKPAQG
jgi:hypothetical protein